MKYEGDSKVLHGINLIGGYSFKIAKVVTIGMVVLVFFNGPEVLPWYKGK